jgi:alpha-beta hydrolase superfamily lysophospholipase
MRSDRGWRSQVYAVVIGAVSHGLMARDVLLGKTRRFRRSELGERFFFGSGERRLAGVWVAAGEGAPAILLCHGIGETVWHWSAVQGFLRERGVASMAFNYSGYGESSGSIRAEHCDEDFVAAYAELRRRVGPVARVSVLGFSLGSGIAANGVGRLTPAPAGLFLCEAFPSFREAVQALWVPGWVAQVFPDIWRTEDTVRSLQMPVCVVHSDGDRLFPVQMARRIASACGGDLVVVAGLSHNEPYLKPTEAYWGPIVAKAIGAGQASIRGGLREGVGGGEVSG